MNGYLVLKNATYNGIGYLAGAIIPEEAVLPSRVPSLLRTGMIAKAENATETQQNGAVATETGFEVFLPIQTENGSEGISVTAEDMITAVSVLQMKQDDAVAAVATVESENALIVVDACTKTMALKKAVRERASALAKDGGEE